jgi:hypothetical protein
MYYHHCIFVSKVDDFIIFRLIKNGDELRFELKEKAAISAALILE